MSWAPTHYDWADAKLVPAIAYPSAWIATQGSGVICGMLESFNPRNNTPHDIIDSINNHNQGTVKKPARYTVDLVSLPYGKAFELLQMVQNGDRYFDVILAPLQFFDASGALDTGAGLPINAWATEYSVYKGCKVEDKGGRYSMGTKPAVTFSCIAMRYTYDPTGTVNVTVGDGWTGPSTSDLSHGIPT